MPSPRGQLSCQRSCLPVHVPTHPGPYVALQVIANKYQSYISMMIDEEKPRTAG
jgi:hypothetical protein